VDEYVVAIWSRDEAEAFLGIEEFHGALSQPMLLSCAGPIRVTIRDAEV
jgi:hypothetical protein